MFLLSRPSFVTGPAGVDKILIKSSSLNQIGVRTSRIDPTAKEGTQGQGPAQADPTLAHRPSKVAISLANNPRVPMPATCMGSQVTTELVLVRATSNGY